MGSVEEVNVERDISVRRVEVKSYMYSYYAAYIEECNGRQ